MRLAGEWGWGGAIRRKAGACGWREREKGEEGWIMGTDRETAVGDTERWRWTERGGQADVRGKRGEEKFS